MAFLGARLLPGVEVVMDATGFAERLRGVGLVISGEGKLDEQSLHGKVPSGVIRAADAATVPVLLVCGQATVQPGGVRVASLAERFGLDRAMRDTAAALEDLVAELAVEWPA